MDKPEVEIKGKDIQLKEELDKINFSKYIIYGAIRIQIREGKKTLVAVERTYVDT